MGQDPEQLRAQIARTREELGQDLDVLAEKVTPSKVVERRVDATKEKVSGLKDKIMGSAIPAGSWAGGGLGGAGHTVSDTALSATSAVTGAAHSTAGLVAQAPGTVKTRAAGNPLAAGIVAFGLGWLVSGLLPASTAEQRGAQKVKQAAQAVAEPVKQGLTSAAGEIKESIAPAAQDAAASIKNSATDAASTVKDQASDAANTVKDQATSSANTVADTAKDKANDVKDTASSSASAAVPYPATTPTAPLPEPNRVPQVEPPYGTR